MKMKLIPLLLALGLTAPGIHAAVTYSIAESTYSQNFDSLSGVTTWADNSTLAGWYARTTATATISSLGANTGSTTTAGLYSFGVAGTNASTERSLGFMTSNGFTGAVATPSFNIIGFNVVNGTGETMTTINIGYDGEQWRRADNTTAHSMTVQYSFDATSLVTGTWTSAGAGLTFTSPQTAATALTLDGNAAANRVAGLTSTIEELAWAAGTGLWIRFLDANDAGNDHTLTIDNFSFSAAPAEVIPEPGAVLLGALGLLALLRRRRLG
jgi:MYXO-CTERM domain-containing protein